MSSIGSNQNIPQVSLSQTKDGTRGKATGEITLPHGGRVSFSIKSEELHPSHNKADSITRQIGQLTELILKRTVALNSPKKQLEYFKQKFESTVPKLFAGRDEVSISVQSRSLNKADKIFLDQFFGIDRSTPDEEVTLPQRELRESVDALFNRMRAEHALFLEHIEEIPIGEQQEFSHDEWHIELSQHEISIIGKKIGEGGFATAKLATSLFQRTIAVASQVRDTITDPIKRERAQEELESSVDISKKLQAEGVPNILKMWRVGGKVMSEYCNGGELSSLLHDKKVALESKVALLAETAAALQGMHAAGICHLDIKPSNILLKNLEDGSTEVRLADFGFSNEENIMTENSFGTREYVAPEMVQVGEKKLQASMDVFSFGVMLYETLYNGTRPFTPEPQDGSQSKNIIVQQDESKVEAVCKKLQQEPNSLAHLTARCLTYSPQQRPTMGEVLQELDSWIENTKSKLSLL